MLGNLRDHDGVVFYRIQRDGDDLVRRRMVIGERGGEPAMLRQPLSDRYSESPVARDHRATGHLA